MKNQEITPDNWEKRAALLSCCVSAILSVYLTALAGKSNSSIVLVILFLVWVLAPFVVMIGSYFSPLWTFRRASVQNVCTACISILSVLLYSRLIPLPGAKPAFVFMIVPVISWLGLLAARFVGNKRNPTP